MSMTIQPGVHPKFGGALITKSGYDPLFVDRVKSEIHWQNRVWWKENRTWMFNPTCWKEVVEISVQVFGARNVRVNTHLFPEFECPELVAFWTKQLNREETEKALSMLPPWLGGNVTAAVKAYHEAQGTKMPEEPDLKKGRLVDL